MAAAAPIHADVLRKLRGDAEFGAARGNRHFGVVLRPYGVIVPMVDFGRLCVELGEQFGRALASIGLHHPLAPLYQRQELVALAFGHGGHHALPIVSKSSALSRSAGSASGI